MGQGKDQVVDISGQTITLTSLDKVLWPKKAIEKATFLRYINDIYPYMIPFIRHRPLTLVRYPHGIKDDSFFQKNCPDYAPDFIKTVEIADINYILCSNRPTLMWLANQLAFEFHVPFQPASSDKPSEIVLDLDPPSRDYFGLAIKAALLIKDILDGLHLKSFIKTSGNKGLQVYIPLPDDQFTYEETRFFTKLIADYLTETKPNLFTTERMKKNRHNRLYVDYLQHAEGKTIIAPYSVRGNDEALVATPLYWSEVHENLRPEQFPIDKIMTRIEQMGCPFKSVADAKATQPFAHVLKTLKTKREEAL